MASHYYLVDRHLRSGLCAGRQRRYQPAAADDVADRRLAQFGRSRPGAGRSDGDPAPADRHGLTHRLSSRRAESRAMGRLSRVPQVLLFGIVAVYLLLPLTAIALYSFATSWTAHALPDGYTLAHWQAAFTNARLLSALGRTFLLALAVLLLDVALVVPAVFWQRVRNPKIRVIVELSAAIPFVLPFIVIAFGILRLYGLVAPQVLGTPWLLLLGQAAIAFPFLYWAVDAAMASIGVVELNEASQVLGANAWQTLWLVVIPQVGPGIASGGIVLFSLFFRGVVLGENLVGGRVGTGLVF